jgi:hypothetical protein
LRDNPWEGQKFKPVADKFARPGTFGVGSNAEKEASLAMPGKLAETNNAALAEYDR